jgi:uncharacterized protein (TIGR03435 family)
VYDIAPTLPEGTSSEQFEAMLQNLLAERFRLRMHRQAKELDAFRLVSVGSPELEATNLVSDDPSKRSLRRYPDGSIMISGIINYSVIDGRIVLSAGKTTTRDLARFLELSLLKSPVTDATNLTGEYNMRFQFSPEGLALPPATVRPSPTVRPAPRVPPPRIYSKRLSDNSGFDWRNRRQCSTSSSWIIWKSPLKTETDSFSASARSAYTG